MLIGKRSLLSCIFFVVAAIGFSPSAYTINEQGSFAVLSVINRNPSLERDLVVQVGTLSGSAEEGMCGHIKLRKVTYMCETLLLLSELYMKSIGFFPGSDFIGSIQTVTFTSGSIHKTVSVYVIDDEAYEGTEDFYATLTTTDTSVRIFEDNASIRIIDDG